MKTRERIVSVLAAGIILGGLVFAWNKEHTESNLQRWYDADNARYFHGELPPVWIHFGDLTGYDADGETKHNDNTGFEIIIDRQAEDKGAIIRHELCHLGTWGFEADAHGKQFIECMRRFE